MSFTSWWNQHLNDRDFKTVTEVGFKQTHTYGTEDLNDYPLIPGENSYPIWIQCRASNDVDMTLQDHVAWLQGTDSQNTIFNKTWVQSHIINIPLGTYLGVWQASNSRVLPRNTMTAIDTLTDATTDYHDLNYSSTVLGGIDIYKSPFFCLHMSVLDGYSLGEINSCSLMLQFDLVT